MKKHLRKRPLRCFKSHKKMEDNLLKLLKQTNKNTKPLSHKKTPNILMVKLEEFPVTLRTSQGCLLFFWHSTGDNWVKQEK